MSKKRRRFLSQIIITLKPTEYRISEYSLTIPRACTPLGVVLAALVAVIAALRLAGYFAGVAAAVTLADAANGAIPAYWLASLARYLGLACLGLSLWLLQQGGRRVAFAHG